MVVARFDQAGVGGCPFPGGQALISTRLLPAAGSGVYPVMTDSLIQIHFRRFRYD